MPKYLMNLTILMQGWIGRDFLSVKKVIEKYKIKSILGVVQSVKISF